ncbi:hypothetical protein V1511DRAFT_494381 [Dipodascopsis uninucleata]
MEVSSQVQTLIELYERMTALFHEAGVIFDFELVDPKEIQSAETLDDIVIGSSINSFDDYARKDMRFNSMPSLNFSRKSGGVGSRASNSRLPIAVLYADVPHSATTTTLDLNSSVKNNMFNDLSFSRDDEPSSSSYHVNQTTYTDIDVHSKISDAIFHEAVSQVADITRLLPPSHPASFEPKSENYIQANDSSSASQSYLLAPNLDIELQNIPGINADSIFEYVLGSSDIECASDINKNQQQRTISHVGCNESQDRSARSNENTILSGTSPTKGIYSSSSLSFIHPYYKSNKEPLDMRDHLCIKTVKQRPLKVKRQSNSNFSPLTKPSENGQRHLFWEKAPQIDLYDSQKRRVSYSWLHPLIDQDMKLGTKMVVGELQQKSNKGPETNKLYKDVHLLGSPSFSPVCAFKNREPNTELYDNQDIKSRYTIPLSFNSFLRPTASPRYHFTPTSQTESDDIFSTRHRRHLSLMSPKSNRVEYGPTRNGTLRSLKYVISNLRSASPPPDPFNGHSSTPNLFIEPKGTLKRIKTRSIKLFVTNKPSRKRLVRKQRAGHRSRSAPITPQSKVTAFGSPMNRRNRQSKQSLKTADQTTKLSGNSSQSPLRAILRKLNFKRNSKASRISLVS